MWIRGRYIWEWDNIGEYNIIIIWELGWDNENKEMCIW